MSTKIWRYGDEWNLGLLVWWGDPHARFLEECCYHSVSEGLRKNKFWRTVFHLEILSQGSLWNIQVDIPGGHLELYLNPRREVQMGSLAL